MTSKIILGAIVAIAFLAGTITTGTIASAAPPTENPGQPFQQILDKFADILGIAMDLNTDITMIKDDVGTLSSDVGTLSSDVTMVKDDQAMLKTQVDDLRCGIIQRNADLSGCNFTDARLDLADLFNADLSGADLTGAILDFADLATADLTGADLTDTDLFETNLIGADLTGADFTDATLEDAIGAPFVGCINHPECV